MGRDGASIGFGGATGAASGAIGGVLASLGPGGWIGLGLFAAYVAGGAALGAGLTAASILLSKSPDSRHRGLDIVETTSSRTASLPVAFGRFRTGGNWIAVGYFWVIKDNLNNTPGRRLRWVNAALGMCEGPVTAIGNLRQDGALISSLANAENLTMNHYQYSIHRGTSTEDIDPIMANGIFHVRLNSPYLSANVSYGETVTGATSGVVGMATNSGTDTTYTGVVATAADPDTGSNGMRVAISTLDSSGIAVAFTVGETINFSGGAHATVAGSNPEVNGFHTPIIPFRNTSTMIVRTICGTAARMPSPNVDGFGPDYTIARSGSTGETANSDVMGYAFFDSYSDSFYYTVASTAGATSTPFGLVGIGRQGQARLHVQPPAAVSSNVTMAWYLGRNDVLVMQDPSSSATFWIGVWGIGRSDGGWEKHTPLPEEGGAGYENPIINWYLDELSGILHTLHDDGTTRYILRWWLLTGRVQKQLVTLNTGTHRAMIYSSDLNCYIVATDSNRLDFIDPTNGATFSVGSVTMPPGALGLCVTGQLVGFITPGACTYFDPFHSTPSSPLTLGPFGSDDNDATQGGIGDGATFISAYQNSFSGHVTLAKNESGEPLLINFIPSVPENKLDMQANGTSGLGGLPDPLITHKAEPDFQDFTTGYFEAGNGVSGWVRDWSFRNYNSWDLIALQGKSSLAGALWASLVDEPNIDSARFGAGRNPKYFNLGSFEGLHWYCVGAKVFANPGDPDHVNAGGATRYAERYKFDFFLDQPTNASSFISDQILLTCQGWRTTIGGIFYVGVEKSGVWPQWTFTEKQIADDGNTGKSSLSIKFSGRSDAPNRVRVSYRDILNEYSHDYAEAIDQYEIDTWGKTQDVALTVDGCGRYDSAFFLAQAVLDAGKGGRRQIGFNAHFVAFVMVPGDTIEISHRKKSLVRVPAKIVSLVEQGAKVVELVALEHRPTLDSLSSQLVPGASPGSGPLQPPNTNCAAAACPLDGSISWVQAGAIYPAGNVTCLYLSGTYVPASSGWNFAVAGFEVVTRDATTGVITHVADAPAVSISSPGWPDQGTAEQHNLGQQTTLTLAAAGSLGLRRLSAGFAGPAGTNPPTYSFCLA